MKLVIKNVKKVFVEDESYDLFSVFLENEDGSVEKSLFEVGSEVETVSEWYSENINSIRNERPMPFLKGNNILKAIDDFYEFAGSNMWVGDDIDEEVEAMWDAVFYYRNRHDLRWCFEGTDIKIHIVGLDFNGFLQVSFCEGDEYFSVKIDDFVVRL